MLIGRVLYRGDAFLCRHDNLIQRRSALGFGFRFGTCLNSKRESKNATQRRKATRARDLLGGSFVTAALHANRSARPPRSSKQFYWTETASVHPSMHMARSPNPLFDAIPPFLRHAEVADHVYKIAVVNESGATYLNRKYGMRIHNQKVSGNRRTSPSRLRAPWLGNRSADAPTIGAAFAPVDIQQPAPSRCAEDGRAHFPIFVVGAPYRHADSVHLSARLGPHTSVSS